MHLYTGKTTRVKNALIINASVALNQNDWSLLLFIYSGQFRFCVRFCDVRFCVLGFQLINASLTIRIFFSDAELCSFRVISFISCLLKDRVPFAVVGSSTIVDLQGRKVRGRVYPWGIVEGQLLSSFTCKSKHCLSFNVTSHLILLNFLTQSVFLITTQLLIILTSYGQTEI